MKKDIVIALIVGLVLGGATAITIVNLPTMIKKPQKPEIGETVPTAIPTPISSGQLELVINQPVDEAIVSTKSLNVSGKTNGGKTVVLETDLEIETKESSPNGSFSFPVNLTEGTNNILVTAYNENNQSETKTLTIFYTSEKL